MYLSMHHLFPHHLVSVKSVKSSLIDLALLRCVVSEIIVKLSPEENMLDSENNESQQYSL